MFVGEICVRRPFPWTHLLGYLAHRLIPQVEQVDDGMYVRRIGADRVGVTFDAASARLQVEVSGHVKPTAVLARIGRLLDVEHDASVVDRRLRRSPLLRPRVARAPGLRPVGAWSPFELGVRTIVGQQVSVAAARTLMHRLVQRCGVLTPECVVAANLHEIGMPGRRVEAIRSFARALLDGHIDFDRPWLEVDAVLKQMPGFGPWTRAYLAIRLGRDPDAFPDSDVGLMRAAHVATPTELRVLAEPWRPYRAFAATYLWAIDL
jgi:3-methyladenine DNA glycosylase/8-oxoguanine DNA glycosylase